MTNRPNKFLSWQTICDFLSTQRQIRLIKSSALFQEKWYLDHYPDVATTGMNPMSHFLKFGGSEGRDPGPGFNSAWYLKNYRNAILPGLNPLVHYLEQGRELGYLPEPLRPNTGHEEISESDNFNSDWYVKTYPDVAQGSIDPYQHFIMWGKAEGRMGTPPKVEIRPGTIAFDPEKETALVVCHNASLTGAPVLGLNIAKLLGAKYNIVCVYLWGGSLEAEFSKFSTYCMGPLPQDDITVTCNHAVDLLVEKFAIKFAIINSVACHLFLPGLSRHQIPRVSLVHEFASYSNPANAVSEVVRLSSTTIFSTSLTLDDALALDPGLKDFPVRLLPQGLCVIPADEKTSREDRLLEQAGVLSQLRPNDIPANTFLVIGVGFVHFRKGVDLFIDCASRLVKSDPQLSFRFAWIGKGYEPDRDQDYSVFLQDQVKRAELPGKFVFMPETRSMEIVYKNADLLMLSSRLDPLPNVAIDAMFHGLPLVCFNKTTGIANLLNEAGLEEACVAPYLDTTSMAEKILAFARSKAYSFKIGTELKALASQHFDMPRYVAEIERLATSEDDHAHI